METVQVTREEFLNDRQGRTFADLAGKAPEILDEVLSFFSDVQRQRRMQESEIHHDRAALAGVVRELECQPAIDRLLASDDPRRSQRLRQAVGVVVRMIMERAGWKKTGKKGSLGVRVESAQQAPFHNTGGLAFWFLRAERYEPAEGMPFASVRHRCQRLSGNPGRGSAAGVPRDKAKARPQRRNP